LLLCLLAVGAHAETAAAPIVRVGTLKFGTVNWELDVMARHGLDRAHGFTLKTQDFAGKDGANVALQGGSVDIIMTDWLWVAKRRAMGGDFTFAPHSHITGGLMVGKDSGINGIADLKGRKIGIGGGELDHPAGLRAKDRRLRSGARGHAGIRGAAVAERDAEARRDPGVAQFLAI